MRHVFPTAESPITITFSSASYERLSVVDITVLQLEGLGGRYLESGYNSLAGVRYLECGHPTSGLCYRSSSAMLRSPLLRVYKLAARRLAPGLESACLASGLKQYSTEAKTSKYVVYSDRIWPIWVCARDACVLIQETQDGDYHAEPWGT